jgi:hypothetical protein
MLRTQCAMDCIDYAVSGAYIMHSLKSSCIVKIVH